jgi:hypothetical protein
MKQITILIFLVTTFYNAFSQGENLQFKLDSIIAEADLCTDMKNLFGIQQIY